MKRYRSISIIAISCVLASAACVVFAADGRYEVSGELKKWHKITLTFSGPQTDETAKPNPFLDYRLNVTFALGKKQYVVPGYYAADANASQTSATSGNKWRVHFVPDDVGRWTFTVSFRTGFDIALSDDPMTGTSVAFDNARGSFVIGPGEKTGLIRQAIGGRDFRTKGLLRYTGKRYLQFAETGEYFLKAGADSPENFLAYADFDGTYDMGELKREGEASGEKFVHRYEPHVRDWKPGDPTWKDGKGKGIIGALNYLAGKGMNSVYFIPYNIDGGDGKDVWPWTNPNEKLRFDCSKLDQWEIVFSHMDKLGLMLHIITQETENDQGLDGGDSRFRGNDVTPAQAGVGPQRKLYYRELIARFGHHLAIVWNLGEENTNTDQQRKDFCRYIKDLDPYDHPIVCHTFPGEYDKVYSPLLGYEYFDGVSLQTNDTHAQTVKWIDRSAAAGRAWFVCLDEIGPAHTGVLPDKDDYWHDEVRKKHLWGNLMAGGAGVEWYFGYKFADNDLNCEDWRSRDHLWDLTRHAIELLQRYYPFVDMSHHDELTSAENDYCFAIPGEYYAIYLPDGGTTNLDLGDSSGKFMLRWYNPRTGGPLQLGSVGEVTGPGSVAIGQPPNDPDKDWVAALRLMPKPRQPK